MYSQGNGQDWVRTSAAILAGAATLTFSLGAEQLAMVDLDGHTSLHAGRFGVVFSRGHGAELRARARVRVPSPLRLKTFRKWW